MSRIGKTIHEALEISKSLIEKDLSKILKTKVEVNFLKNNLKRVEIFSEFKNIMDFIDETTLKVESYKETPELLKVKEKEKAEYFLAFDSLRSNCRVTHQPDFGDAFIYYKSTKHIDENSLVQYLISFRSEYHFHEECCEMIFKRLQDILNKDDQLFVCALYTRRGGIDICPVRWNQNCTKNFAEKLLDLSCYARNGIKQ
jgi:7-cyano-7-deazaguanine reductase